MENARIVEEHETIVERVAGLAKQWKIWISGSVIAANTGGKPTNASILFSPRGERAVTYNKTHLFSLMDEDEHVAPGDELVLFDAPWGKTGFAVCYDIRFPELYRSYALKGAEVLLNPTAFPHPRREHWRTLVRARAIENQMFMIGTNQVGFEEMGELGKVSWCGTSLIIDPWGNTVVEASETEEELLTASIEVDCCCKDEAEDASLAGTGGLICTNWVWRKVESQKSKVESTDKVSQCLGVSKRRGSDEV